MMQAPPLSKARQRIWRRQHIRTRIFAMIANPADVRLIQKAYPLDSPEHLAFEALFHASWEGRLAATRWLIEFVGIVNNSKGRAVWAHKQKNPKKHDLRITALAGGKPISPRLAREGKLAS